MIRLFDDNAREFTTNGLGPLPSAMSCFVTEEANGPFELEMVYPVTGKRFSEIHNRSIIVCKPNPFTDPQAFRVYSMSRPIDGLVTINAAHISYDLNGITVSPFQASNAADALSKIALNATTECPFTFWTDKTTTASMAFTTPTSARAILAGEEGSILDTYHGEYEWDNFTVRLRNNRGADRGVLISYGKNLTDINHQEDISSMYTGIHPYYYSEEEGLHELPEKILKAEGNFGYQSILAVDFSSEWTDYPGDATLRQVATTYMKNNDIGKPKISVDISFVQLSNSKEYETLELLEKVQLFDTVTVRSDNIGVNVKSKCVSYKYNVLTDVYDEITLGEVRANLATSIASSNNAVQETISNTKSFLEEAIDRTTKTITGGLGGYVVIHSSSSSKKPDEILIMDTDNIQTAKKVWRWNKGGLGYSSTGYNGPYGTAITQQGQIVANYITTGTLDASIISVTNLNASNITTGTLSSKDGNTYINLNTGDAKFSGTVYASKLSGQIVGSQIANNTIQNGNIADGTIQGGKVGGSTLSGGNLQPNTVARGNLVERYATTAQFDTLNASVANFNQIITGGAKANYIRTTSLLCDIFSFGPDAMPLRLISPSSATYCLGT